ncbi:response regulator [Shewanella gelidii]|uniref:diguanylate cyclase n=1 Tax=Shewanella gelidii TaxID=1642821 RepID=A0A917JSA8_9GAMM|nr:response regulator [Shewanella gelidii]MCL1098351.1 diguanylate cyclase [Shewanella gelidii]GGI84572.1 diguanylate cyclase [Shewanella gelidii]
MRILVVEDSQVVAKILRHLLQQELDCIVDIAPDLTTARTFLEQEQYFVAIADLSLPDANGGQIVEVVQQYQVPCIVATATLDSAQRKRLLSLGIVDYVFKENRFSYEYIVKLVKRLHRNQKIKVLVADDSSVSRNYIRALLEQHLFQVMEAKDGAEALALLQSSAGIKLLITDYNMPTMDGFELIIKARELYLREELAIIGLSNDTDESLSARFIKNGANDFLQKPFVHEEFHCRVLNTLDALEMLRLFWKQANYDYLTQVYNRRYFFDYFSQQMPKISKKKTQLAVGLIDIDFFKKVNDNYGHDVGDEVLIEFSARLRKIFADKFIVARIGGEEFVVALKGLKLAQAHQLFDDFREKLAAQPIVTSKGDLKVTISIGLHCRNADESIDEMIKIADQSLYRAKEQGRNLVCVSGLQI